MDSKKVQPKLMQTKIVRSVTADSDGPLSGTVGYNQDNLKKIEQSMSVRATHQRINIGFDHLSHIGYTELNVNSDNESEVLLSDDDNYANAQNCENNPNEDIAVGFPPSSIAREAPVEVSEESKHSFLDDVPPSLNARPRETFESTLTSVEDVPSSSVGRETPLEASEKSKLISADDVRQSSEGKEIPAQISTQLQACFLVDVLPLSSAVETPVQGLKENCITRAEEIWQKAMTDCEEICETRTAVTDCEEICKARTRSAIMTETAAETNSVSGDSGLQGSNLLDLGDAYKLAVGSRGRQLSGALAEQWIGKDSSRFSDDLKLLFSQLSAARELSINDTSPRVAMSPKLSVNSDELRNPVASSALGMQILQKRISLERNESGLSLDGSIVSEIEGESVVDRLKRQVEHDKKLLQALYKELEEERNASAIAANQAMAMITRLQEEKATLQMEALQYLRMMEEQALIWNPCKKQMTFS
ncbi:hypothetical protein GH714_002324 [Hevea brasiliensis]|uniref:GTD-binding domain-containing protein n=1 Tax=Hevea brasiliensis TaxID=3981 RepID=A0A6A6KIF1_HEVBR|nr:hypothetical protein GH714_002324 [Hevea brasiliensis]